MGQLLRLVLIIVALWLIIRFVQTALARMSSGSKSGQSHASQHHKIAAKNVVPCALCGVHIPETEAIASHGRFYCNQDHRKADSKADSRVGD